MKRFGGHIEKWKAGRVDDNINAKPVEMAIKWQKKETEKNL